ncbi:MAG: hypothetical protein K2X87_22175 [Gemmataceae bacterium]|nr:hypothetical protein [Gemmataceae bacterium]
MSVVPGLRDATVQDIQLELIRRTKFNTFDGERVYSTLIRHRGLWRAALLDRPGLPAHARPGRLLTSGLIKLRDMDGDTWNVDTLFVLTPTRATARELARVAAADRWGGAVRVYEDSEEIDRALGGGGDDCGLISVWWD